MKDECETPVLRRDNTSGITGVSYCRTRKKWVAQISCQGKRIPLGRFNTPEEAALAYASACDKRRAT